MHCAAITKKSYNIYIKILTMPNCLRVLRLFENKNEEGVKILDRENKKIVSETEAT